jgi:hypothetical protein
MKPRLSERARTAVAAALFAAALGVAVLRVGALTHVGSLRLGAPAAMNDFYSSVYYPVRAFLNGENPHDRERLKALYPQVEEYPPYLPLNLVLYLPFGLLPPRIAAVAYFVFSAALTLPLSVVALRLAGSLPSPWRVTLVAALLLLSRPGHWTLISGQHAILLVLLSYLALLHARRSPVLSGIALGVCMYKVTYGIPLALLMLACGYAPAVGIGALVAGAVNTPLLLLLARRASGVGPFLQKLSESYQYWQNLPGMDPGTSLDPMSFNRIDAATFVSRFVGHPVPSAVSMLLAAAVLGAAALGLRRLAKHRGRAAEDLSLALICLGLLIAVYHMTYDIVLLTAPLAALVARGLPRPAPSAWNAGFIMLFAVPGLNWALSQSALQAWQPAHSVWLVVASVNTACLLTLFAGYLALALAYTGPPASLATTPVNTPPLLNHIRSPRS